MIRIAKRISLFSTVLGLVALSTAGGALSAQKAPDSAEKQDRYENLELFQKVLHFVEANYVDEVQYKDLIHGAIKGMLETLDPHSNFLPPEVFKDMKVDTSGKFGGLGIEIGMKDNILTVVAPIEDTPAWKAGIKPEDRIIKINGDSTKGMTLVEAVQAMRGKKGSDVVLTVYRSGSPKPADFRLVRDVIKVQSVKYDEIEPHYGYVRLTNFNESAAADIKRAIGKLEKNGKLQGLVLDLRTNPGGLLDQAVEVSSLFIDDGVVVSTIGRDKKQQEVKYARKGSARKDFPVAVLVNSSTASAAEIVAGALQDHHRAIIMGQPTFGKGSVQTVVELSPDMGLKLTIARYFTPSGRSIQEKGVQPDILLDDFDTKVLAEARRKRQIIREKDLKGHMKNTGDVGASGREQFDVHELQALAADKSSGSSEKEDDDETPARFDPKEDYQVGEALNHLKSFELYRKIAASAAEGTLPKGEVNAKR